MRVVERDMRGERVDELVLSHERVSDCWFGREISRIQFGIGF